MDDNLVFVKNGDATENPTDLKTHTAAETGFHIKTEVEQERSWTESDIPVQQETDSATEQSIHMKQEADSHDSTLCETNVVKHDMQTEAFTHRKQPCTQMGSTSPCQVTHGSKQWIQETPQTHFTVKDEPAVMHQEQISQRLCPSRVFSSPEDVQSTSTQTDSISVKTEPQDSLASVMATPSAAKYAMDSTSGKKLEDTPTLVYPVCLYQNVHATDCKSEASVSEQLGGEPTPIVSDAGRLDTGECETLLKEHMVAHTGEKRFECKNCCVAFTTSSDLKQHIMVHAGETERPHECKQCGTAFSHLDSLKQHMKTHSADKPYVCKHCTTEYTRLSNLKRHVMTLVSAAGRVDTGECKTPFGCNQCGATFTTSFLLKQHTVTHIGETPYECKNCCVVFTSSSDLKQHMTTHTGEGPHKCKQCGAAFSFPSQMKQHMMTHTGEKPYVCKHCAVAFTQLSNLKTHMRTHTGEKPYQCKQCGKAFHRSGHLKQHIKIHSSEKPYECTQCSAAFTRPSHLKRHMRTHTDDVCE